MEAAWFILGAILGGISLYLANVLERHFQKPSLSWDRNSIRMRTAHLNTRVPPTFGRPDTRVAFYCCQIAVKNSGKTAAQNCSGHLEIVGNREHISWLATKGPLTINRDDFEFLEVCGFQEPDGLDVTERKRIAPTENGWADSGMNRPLDLGGEAPIDANIVVTASNTESIRLPITILPVDAVTDPNKPLFEIRKNREGTVSKQDISFNPLSWGILFFTLWLTVQALNTTTSSQKNFSWFFLGLSIIALVSIPWRWLRNLLNSQRASQIILPIVFELTVAGYVIGWVGMLKDVHGAVLALTVAIGFIWLIVYIMVAAAKFVKPYFRALTCAIFLLAWIYFFIQSGLSGSWPLIIVTAAVFWASIKPQQFRWIPLI
ncbi:MAG: hypothetical protein A2Z28_00715 [Chloroflexi bacterium RBG_16_51_9]|nr:MAG: hypothetical protein A2Z28_00715 [Chloroflexi bacterium RBG_16_51_9]